MPVLVYLVARVVAMLCLALLGIALVFDTQVERVTAGKPPIEFAKALDADLPGQYARVVGVGHNVGDDLATERDAVAYGVDAVEIDVRSDGSELFAAHDAPLAFLEDIAFRGPSLAQAWRIASLRPTILLHLKQNSPAYLRRVRDFVAVQPRRHLIVQNARVSTLRWVQRNMPDTERLLLVFDSSELAAVRRDPSLGRSISGLSVRDSLVTPAVQRWVRRRGLKLYVWVVDSERRMNDLIRHGVDGLITERLDMMELLGKGTIGQ